MVILAINEDISVSNSGEKLSRELYLTNRKEIRKCQQDHLFCRSSDIRKFVLG